MRILPPSDQLEQFNIYEFVDWVPAFVPVVVLPGGESGALTERYRLPSTSYRARYNERTDSWTCDWFDEDGAVIDQGRRLSADSWIRAPWIDEGLPTPMPSWIAFVDTSGMGAEASFDSFGRSHKLVELDFQDIIDAGIIPTTTTDVTVTIV